MKLVIKDGLLDFLQAGDVAVPVHKYSTYYSIRQFLLHHSYILLGVQFLLYHQGYDDYGYRPMATHLPRYFMNIFCYSKTFLRPGNRTDKQKLTLAPKTKQAKGNCTHYTFILTGFFWLSNILTSQFSFGYLTLPKSYSPQILPSALW